MFVHRVRELRVVCVIVVDEERDNRFNAQFYLPDGKLVWEMEDVPLLLVETLAGNAGVIQFKDE